jgi:cytochrome subunit of sulfide dehydrogenase
MRAKRISVAAALFLNLCIGTDVIAQEAPPGAASCSGCHPANAGVETPVPPLAGRNAAEMLAQMQAFRAGGRSPTVMHQIANGFTDLEVQAIAAWFAAQR